jgi:hypothetical protein
MPDPLSGLVLGGSAIAGGLISSNAQKKAAQGAANAEVQAANMQIGESRRQFDEIRALLNPYVESGTDALSQQQALLGLSGTDAQRSALGAIEQSPQMAALLAQGENAMLQNASATGGLRGGNIQAALAQFRPQLLSSLIESQYSKLGGLASMGQNAAAGVGNAGMQSTSQINQALGSIGSAQAGAALARGQANAQLGGTISNLGGLFGGYRMNQSLGGIGGIVQPSTAGSSAFASDVQARRSASDYLMGF